MKTTKVIFVRHGETEWNTEYKIQGSTDIELNENGRRQAKDVAKRFQDEDILIFSSPLKRAFYTAEMIANGRPIIVKEEMKEINFGDWEGYRFDQKKDDPNYIKFCKGEDGGPFGNSGNTIESCAKANATFIYELVKQYQGQTLVCVSHGACSL